MKKLWRNESWGIYTTPEITASLVIIHTPQKRNYTPTQAYCAWEAASEWAE